MRLNKLTLKNIRSFEDQEILFPDGTLLLAGDVGSGKTSLLLAIEYALFGLQPGQRGTALLRNTSESAEVMLSLEVAGHDLTIERRLKRSAKSVSNEYAAITIDGEKFELSISEIKTKIIKLLNYPDEFIKKNNILYRYTVYTPQEQMKQIIQEDSETRLNVLRHIFGIDKYKRMRENITIILQQFKEQIKHMDGQISTLKQDKNQLKEIDKHLKSLAEKEKQTYVILEQKQYQRKEAEQELQKLGELRKEKEQFSKEIEKTKILQSAKQDGLFSITKEKQELEQLLSDETKTFDNQELMQIVQQLQQQKDQIQKTQQEYHALEAQQNTIKQRAEEELRKKERIFKIDICPTCLQDVSDIHKHNILNEVEKTLSQINNQEKEFLIKQQNIKLQLENLAQSIQKLEQQRLESEVLKAKQEDIKRARQKLSQINQTQESHEKDYNFLEKHLISLKENLLTFSTFDVTWKKKQEVLQETQSNEKQIEINIAELKKEQELTDIQKVQLQNTIIEKEHIKSKLNERMEISTWLSEKIMRLLSSIEHQVLLKLRQEFSHLFRKWFQMLAGEYFDTQLDETFTPIIIQRGIEMEYQFLSGGERTAVALAYRLALNQTINSVLSNIQTKDVIILDEPTDGFSAAQITKMRDIFEELDIAQLIIVSHESQIENFVENIIRLKKEGNTSIVELQPQKTITQ